MNKLQRFKKTTTTVLPLNNDTTPVSATRPLNNETTPKPMVSPLNRGMGSELHENVPLSRGQSDSFGGSHKPQDRKVSFESSGINPDAIAKFERINYNPQLNARSKQMSREMTKAECHIWFNLLSKKQLDGYKFIKQKIVYNYILDFYCSELLLAIEIDGDTHNIEYDKVRDDFVASLGIQTLRFSNQDVFNNLEGVKQEILHKIRVQKYI
jgi:very-short-patch-repair endonuclease